MTDTANLYLKLPVALQNALCSLQGWRIQRSRFGPGFHRYLQEVERRSFWAPEQIAEFRDQRLRAFVQHCVNSVPYYRRRFKELGLRAEDIRKLDDLRHLPILTKAEVQAHIGEFISEALPKEQLTTVHTSGTTGTGLRFASTLTTIQEQWAVWWRYRRWHGLQLDTWSAHFGGRQVVPLSQTKPPFWRYNYPGRQILFSAYHMSPGHLEAFARELRRRQPPWLHGYPSLLALIAAYILDSGFDLGYQVRWITLGSENVLQQQVELIERAFGVRPLQHYGLAEAVANISQCERGNLHVDEDFAAVEFVPNADGVSHRIIGTNLANPATPLLRYDAQDIVGLTPGLTCDCGRPGRVVARIDGRQEDYVILRNGTRLVCMDRIFRDTVTIREAQIHQKLPGKITLRIVRGEGYTQADEHMLLTEARRIAGDDLDITIEYVDRLERTRAGKLRFVVSELREGHIGEIGQSLAPSRISMAKRSFMFLVKVGYLANMVRELLQ